MSTAISALPLADLFHASSENFLRYKRAEAGNGVWEENDRQEEHELHLAIIERALSGDSVARAYIDEAWDTGPTDAELKEFLEAQRSLVH